MMKYRLSYYGMGGFDFAGFNSKEEAIEFALHQASLGLMTPLQVYKYNAKKDEYVAIIEFKKA